MMRLCSSVMLVIWAGCSGEPESPPVAPVSVPAAAAEHEQAAELVSEPAGDPAPTDPAPAEPTPPVPVPAPERDAAPPTPAPQPFIAPEPEPPSAGTEPAPPALPLLQGTTIPGLNPLGGAAEPGCDAKPKEPEEDEGCAKPPLPAAP
jgi:hypothetical protein